MTSNTLHFDKNIRSPLLGFFDIQLQISQMVAGLINQMNPYSTKDMVGLESMQSLQKEISAYSVEENLRSHNPIFNTQNGINPYHVFLEGQKARKFILESALVQTKNLKIFFPIFASELQQMENYIRANIAFTFTTHRPEWNLNFPNETIESLDFADIVKFEAPTENPNGRNMLLIAPMSGHFATLLRKTVESLHNAGYTVYITDWKSPFDIPKDKGAFTVDRYTEEVLNAYRVVAGDAGTFDVLAICQPSPEALTATAFAEENQLPKPRSLALMAGPIDVSQSPTAVNKASEKLTPELIDRMSLTIPEGKNIGAGRKVYPAPLQIMSFISAKPQEHLKNYQSLAYSRKPLTVEQEKMLAFYREYFAVMDLPHTFYKETVNRVFRGNEWASGQVQYQGEMVDLSKMTTPLITVEGGRDDICGIGQTSVAQRITSPSSSAHINLPDAGHYGTFAGKDFRGIVLPAFDAFYTDLENQSRSTSNTPPSKIRKAA